MEGKIIGEDDDGFGVNVIDSEGVSHTVAVGFDGTVQGHSQDGYPDDPDARTERQNDMVNRSEDFARWFLDKETDHQTAPWYMQTERLKSAKSAIAKTANRDLEQLFEPFYRYLTARYRSSSSADIDEVVPPGSAINEYREIRAKVYVENGEIEKVSEAYVMYYTDIGEQRLAGGDDPFPERNPDTWLEHPPIDIERASVPAFLNYHLRCQIRDSFLLREEEPPEEYRVVGPGTDRMVVRCMTYDHLPNYYEYGADIDGYRAEDTFNAGAVGRLLDLF